MLSRHLPSLLALVVCAQAADAKITAKVTLEQIVKDQPLIFTAKVTEFLPDKPGIVFTPADKLRGEFPFDRVPVNLTGDKEAIDEKQPAKLLERLDKDLPLIVFALRRGKVYDAVAYTNGTWFRMAGVIEQQEGKEVTRWRFTHCEPYFRRTFKGTTEDLIKAVEGGIKGENLPPYDEKEEPGFGPPLKKAKVGGKEPLARGDLTRSTRCDTRVELVSCRAPTVPLGVIQIPFLGLIAALAALFPAVFGGMALVMRRWVLALSVASFVSLLAAVFLYFPKWISWTGLRSLSGLWLTGAVVAGLGALWAARRYRRAIWDDKADDFQPRYFDRIGLTVLTCLAAGSVLYAVLAGEPLRDSPWLELLLLAVPTIACLYFVLGHWLRSRGDEPKLVPVSAETVGLWAACFACAVAGAALMTVPRGPAIVAGGGKGGVKLVEQPLWVFEPKENGEIVSTPCVTPERVFVSVHHRQGLSQYGRLYALDPDTGRVLWDFDDEGKLKPTFCTPTCVGGRLYFGEGYHTDRDSKLFCLDATTGTKLWAFQTDSHTESTPIVVDGKVVFGAGDDGVYCLDAVSGQKIWQYMIAGGLHVDSNPLVYENKVYAGSGVSKRSRNTRIFCLDLATGNEQWVERTEYSAWGSPGAAGNEVIFVSGNGTYSEDRPPVAGLVLCRDAATGRPVWERALPNSLVCRPAVDRYQAYVGTRDGNVYALDRRTGEVLWSKALQGPVLASQTIDVQPRTHIGECLYAIGCTGNLEALSPADGAVFWSVSFRDLIDSPHVNAVSTPVVVREEADGKVRHRIYVGLGFGPSAAATPTARLYCFQDSTE